LKSITALLNSESYRVSVKMKTIRAVEFIDDHLRILDQTKLPFAEEYIITDDVDRIALAIERLEIRGAPAIGVTAAYALALSLKNIPEEKHSEIFENSFSRLSATRPTAVNLFYALNYIRKTFVESAGKENLYNLLIEKAVAFHKNDVRLCELIATHGMEIFSKKSRVLTHCNAGALATGGDGTALNVIHNAFINGMVEHVYADETRPLLQGSRLTAWELSEYGIPFSIQTDSTAAVLMKLGKIDLVVVGADRIAVNGDSANKIGTYNLAVLCSYHKIPFYIAAPDTTIDYECATGDRITIEFRDNKELTRIGSVEITNSDFPAYCPAFDVTPGRLITAIITDKKIYKPPFSFSND